MEELLKYAVCTLIIVICGIYLYEHYYEKEQFTLPTFDWTDFKSNINYNDQVTLTKIDTPPIKNVDDRNRRIMNVGDNKFIVPNNKIIYDESRNPLRNPNTDHKYNKNKLVGTGVRDLDDKMPTLKYSPMQGTECNYFGENDMYTKSILQYGDLDNVDRINDFRSSDQKQYVGSTISDIFDKLNGNDIKEQNDLLSREGTSFSPAGRGFKTMNSDRWHYPRENSMCGGALYGFSGLKGNDPDLLNYPVITQA